MCAKNCDFTSMKIQVTGGMREIADELLNTLQLLNNSKQCILCNLESINERFHQIEATASTYYLNCYLADFTDKHDMISSCVQRLSAIRCGALMVIERNQNIDDLIQKGTPIDAELTSALLETIFYPGSPLHDGAVLIRGDKIVSAANVLPLTSTNFNGKKMGTRHRAAIGLSERSDALVLVVSEETGRISFAFEGNLYPINTVQL